MFDSEMIIIDILKSSVKKQEDKYTKKVYKSNDGQMIYIMKNDVPVGILDWSIEKYFSGHPWGININAYGPDYVKEKEAPRSGRGRTPPVINSKDKFSPLGGKTLRWYKKSDASKRKNQEFKKAIAWLEKRLGIKGIMRLPNK